MKLFDCLLAILITAVWGFNFVFIKLGLNDCPPILLCTLRFTLSGFPAVFFLPRPNIKWSILALYGLFMFGIQFCFLFIGLSQGVEPGVASLIAQLQIFFSMFLASLFLKEFIHPTQIIGAIIAFSGIGIVWLHLNSAGTYLGFSFIVMAALSWGIGNLITKKLPSANPISLVVWGSFITTPLLICATLITDGYSKIVFTISHFSLTSILSIIYIVYASTWFAYGLWGNLLKRYPVATVAPFTLLVPVFGMLGAHCFFAEPFPLWKFAAGSIVILGLSINIFGKKVALVINKNINKINQLETNNQKSNIDNISNISNIGSTVNPD